MTWRSLLYHPYLIWFALCRSKKMPLFTYYLTTGMSLLIGSPHRKRKRKWGITKVNKTVGYCIVFIVEIDFWPLRRDILGAYSLTMVNTSCCCCLLTPSTFSNWMKRLWRRHYKSRRLHLQRYWSTITLVSIFWKKYC